MAAGSVRCITDFYTAERYIRWINSKQRESAARYGYDISKALVIAAIVTAVTKDANLGHVFQLIAGAAVIFFAAWRFES